VSRLPSEPAADNQEVLDCFNALLASRGEGRTLEVDRRDPQQEWASIAVSNQETADVCVAMSRVKQLLLRGKQLKVEHHRGREGVGRGRGRGDGASGRGSFGSRAGGTEAGDDERGNRQRLRKFRDGRGGGHLSSEGRPERFGTGDGGSTRPRNYGASES
ncbi:unnamed protein product, partial [Polarella glacialis]